MVETHKALVKRIANHLAARMPASVQIDDLVSVRDDRLTGKLHQSMTPPKAPALKRLPVFVFVEPCWMKFVKADWGPPFCLQKQS